MARTVSRKRKRTASHTGLTVKDIWGDNWLVAERRPTDYRFAVHMGWPLSPSSGLSKSGKAAVIVTEPLAKHMRSRAQAQRPYAYPLPIGDNARRRIRDLLNVGHREWTDTRTNWWLDRIDDLGSLSSAKFVAKHGKSGWTRMGTMSTTLVWQMRTVLLGRQRYEVGWWKSPEVAALVLSKTIPLEEIAKRLKLSPASVYGIRYRLNKLAGRTRKRTWTAKTVKPVKAAKPAKAVKTAKPAKATKAVKTAKAVKSAKTTTRKKTTNRKKK